MNRRLADRIRALRIVIAHKPAKDKLAGGLRRAGLDPDRVFEEIDVLFLEMEEQLSRLAHPANDISHAHGTTVLNFPKEKVRK